uniref:CD6 molecule n=1 Tax=Falco tinnunculus TaxID=100819 RepID=A0A8C4UMB4_FALTI
CLPALSRALGVCPSGGTSVCPTAISPTMPPLSLLRGGSQPRRRVPAGSAPHTLCPFLLADPTEPMEPRTNSGMGDGARATATPVPCASPAPGTLRLAGGRSRCEGRVEMEQAGAWGTVCDDAWDLADADVVCRQLRCGWAVRTHGSAAFGRGTGPILRDEVRCKGHEEHLWDCPAELEHDCSHKEDAGVVCSEHQEWRLSGGRDGCAGRVEVFFRGTWSTVCDSTWYELEASVLCHTLGCGEPLRQLAFGHTLPGRMLYQCESQQPSLAHCQWTYNKSAPCHQSQAAGVVCNGMRSPLTWEGVTLPAQLGPPHTQSSAQLRERGWLCHGAAEWATPLVHAAHTMSSHGLAGPVLVTHSTQNPSAPSGTSNDYRDMPPSLPKGPVPAPPTAKDSDSDSDYEHYDFSSKPPVALSTFYSEHPTQPWDPCCPALGAPADAPSLPSPQTHCAGSPASSCSLLSPPWVPVSPADPEPTDSSSTSSGEWYENVQDTEPPGDLSSDPGEDPTLTGQEWGGAGGCRAPLPPQHPPPAPCPPA